MLFSIPQNSAKKEIGNLWQLLLFYIPLNSAKKQWLFCAIDSNYLYLFSNCLFLFSIRHNFAKSNSLFVVRTQGTYCYFVSNSSFMLQTQIIYFSLAFCRMSQKTIACLWYGLNLNMDSLYSAEFCKKSNSLFVINQKLALAFFSC